MLYLHELKWAESKTPMYIPWKRMMYTLEALGWLNEDKYSGTASEVVV
jgi:hypothetical protein